MLNLLRHWFYRTEQNRTVSLLISLLYNISTKGQADLGSFIQGHSYWTALYIYLSIFFSEFTGLFELKFHMIKQYKYDIIFRSLDPDGHCPYMVKQNMFK